MTTRTTIDDDDDSDADDDDDEDDDSDNEGFDDPEELSHDERGDAEAAA